MKMSTLSGLLLPLAFTLFGLSDLSGQTYRIRAVVESVEANFPYGDEHDGIVDITWKVNGTLDRGRGRVQSLNSLGLHLNRPTGNIFSFRNHVLIDQTFSGGGLDLCSDKLTLRLNFESFENDCNEALVYNAWASSACAFFNPDDYYRTGSRTIVLNQYDADRTGRQVVRLGGGIYTYTIAFFYQLVNPLRALEIEGAANVLCEGSNVKLVARTGDGFTGGTFDWRRRPVGGGDNDWTRIYLSKSKEYVVPAINLRNFDYGVRLLPGTSIFGQCAGDLDVTRTVERANLTIVPALQELPITTTPACEGAGGGSITFNGPASASNMRVRLSLDGPTIPPPVEIDGNGSYTFSNLASGNYRLLATSVTFNGVGLPNSNCTTERQNIPIALAPVPRLLSVVGQRPGCGQNQGRILMTVAEGSGRAFRFRIEGVGASAGEPTREIPENTNGFIQGAGTFALDNVNPGTYQVTAMNVTGCESAPTPVTVAPTPPPATGTIAWTPDIPGVDIACKGDRKVVTVSVPASQGATRVTLSRSGGFSPQFNEVLPGGGSGTTSVDAGTYDITFTVVSTGCTATFTRTLTEAADAFSAVRTATVDATSCMPSGGSVTAEVFNGTPPYTLQYSGASSGTLSQSESVFNVMNLARGSYSLLFTDANGCQAISGAFINSSSPLSVNPNQSPAPCAGENGTITVFISGGLAPYDITVSDISTAPSTQTQYNDVPPGMYTVTVTDANGCMEVRQVTVEDVDPLIVSDVTIENLPCEGNLARLSFTITGREISFTPPGGEGPCPGGFQYGVSLDGGVTWMDVTDNYSVAFDPIERPDEPPICSKEATIFYDVPPGDYDVQVRFNGNRDCRSNTVAVSATAFDIPPVLTGSVTGVTPTTCGLDNGAITVAFGDGVGGDYTIILYQGFSGDELGQEEVRRATAAAAGSHTFFNLSAGSCYGVELRRGGCSLSIPEQSVRFCNNPGIEVPATPTVDLTEITNTGPELECDDSGAEITVTGVSGGMPPYEYGLVLGDFGTSNVLNPTDPFNTRVYVRDANGCVDSLDFDGFQRKVVVHELTITPTTPASTCSDGTLQVTIQNGRPPYQLRLVDRADDVTIRDLTVAGNSTELTDIPAGAYRFIVVDTFTCETAVEYDFAITPPLTAVTLDKAAPTCESISDGRMTISVSGGMAPYTIIYEGVPSVGAERTITDLDTDEYTFVIFDAFDCAIIHQDSIVASPFLSLTSSSTPPTPCGESPNGTLTVTPTGGTGAYTLTWLDDPDNPVVVQAGASSTRTGLGSGERTARVTDLNGCEAYLGAPISGPDTVLATVNILQEPSCTAGGSLEILATGGDGTFTYAIAGQPAQADSVFTDLPPGDYTFTITDGNGCSNQNTVTATIGPGTSIRASASTVSPSCGGESDGEITITVSGGSGPITYSLNGGPAQSESVFTGLSAGFYTVTVSRDGCEQTITDVQVTEAPVLALQLSESTDPCTGVVTYTLSATGGTGGYTYSLSGANQLTDNTFTLSGGDAGAGQVEDGSGCTATLPVSAPAFSALMIDGEFITDANCDDGTGSLAVSVSGGTPPYRFQWSNGGPADSLFTGVSAGIYSVEVLDANDCRVTSDPLIVSFFPGITVTPSATNANCGAADGTITLTVGGGTNDYTYEFSAGVSVTDNVATGLSAGTYAFTVTDNLSGCTAMGEETISTTEAPVISLDAQTPRGCDGNNGTATVSASGGTPGYTYAWSNGETGPMATSLSEGISTVTVTDAVGCTDEITVDILIAEAPALSIVSQTVTSCNADDATATVSASGGTPGYTFAWSNGQSGPTAGGLAAGAYTVTVTDANGCTDATEVTIEVAPSPTLSLESQLPTECDGTNGSATVSASGGTPDYNYAWSSGETGPTASALPGGASTVTVTDARGCTDVLTVTIVERSSPTLSLSAQTPTSCDGTDGTATVTASGGTPEYTYVWEDGQTGPTASNLAGGTISVTVTDATGCTDVLSVDIEGITSPALSLVSQTATDCNGTGAAATVSASGGTPDYTFNWSNGESGPTASDLPAGPNGVTVTDANGCTDILSVTIEATPSPTIAIDGQTNTGCAVNDGTATVSASGGTPDYTFAWSNGQSGPTASGLAAGAYTVTVTDDNGCTDATEVTIEVAPSPTLSLESQLPTECDGTNGSATVSATGGTPDYNYAWSNGETGPTASALPGGASTVTVTDARGCTAVLTVTIVERSSPTLSLSTQTPTSCDGTDGTATVTASGGTPEYTYVWEDGQTGPTASNLAGGTISVTVTDATGCTDVLSVDIEGITSPALSLVSQTATDCNGTGAAATVSASGGTPDYTFNWSNGESGPTASDLPAGPNGVTVTDANGCTDILSVTIEATPSPTIAVDGQTTTGCTVNDGTATVSASGGTPDYTFAWSNGQSGPTASGLAAGAYTVTVTDANGCSDATEVTIEVAPSPTLSLESQLPTECDGTNGSATVSASGGTPDYNYAWSSGETGPTASALPGGASTVTVTDARGCTDVLTVTIVERSSPTLSLSAQTPTSCDGTDGTATVTASGGTPEYTYLWEDGQTGPTASNLAGGTISVTVTDATGCTDVLSVDIEGITSPALSLVSQTATDCNGTGAAATVSASGGTPDYTFNWSNGESGPTASDLPAGPNGVTVTDANGCTDILSVTIEATPSPTIAIDGQTNTGCAVNDGTATVSASGGTPDYTFAWSNGQSGPTAGGLAAGAYTVTVTDANGCTDATEVTIEVAPSPTLSLESQLPTECDGTNGSATVSASGGTPDYNYAWSSGETGPTASALPGGASTVTVTDARGCTDVLTVTIVERSSPTLSLSAQTPTSCDGTDGTATVTASGGTPEYTYVWEDGQTGPTASNLAGGTISVTVTDATGCTDVLSVDIEGITSPALSLVSQTATDCNGTGAAATVSASGGTPDYTFNWSNGESGPTASDLPAGPNGVTVTDANGCTDILSVTIEATPSPTIAIDGQTNTGCAVNDGTATVSASGGTPDYTFAWSNGQSGPTAGGLAAGAYTVTVTDANGCTDATEVTIEVAPSPTLSLESQLPTECDGTNGSATVSASGGTPDYNYAWSSGETGPTASALPGGASTVTVTDARGCTDVLTVTIVERSSPTLSLSAQTPTSCDGTDGTATVTASGGTPEYTYLWEDGQTGPTASNLAGGTISVTVTDATGCTDVLSVDIEGITSPTLSLERQTFTRCDVNDGSATVSASGGMPEYAFAWSNGETGPTASALGSGPNTVTVTDGNGCTDELEIIIEEAESPSLSIVSQSETSCDATDGTATVSASGGTPDYLYQWEDGQTGTMASNLAGGLISVTVTDANGCTDVLVVDIVQLNSPVLELVSQGTTNCEGTGATATVQTSGGVPGYSYSWSNGETEATAVNLVTGPNSVTVTDAAGCTDVLTVDIVPLPQPVLMLQSQTPTECDGVTGAATVLAEGGTPAYIYSWSNGEEGPTATELPIGLNTVTVTDAAGCTDEISVTIIQRTSPVLALEAQSPTSCDGTDGIATVSASGGTPGYTYAWEDGQTGPSVSDLAPGPITVTVTDGAGCTDVLTILIEGIFSPTISLTNQTPTSCETDNGTATVSASGGTPEYTYTWSNGETGPTATSLPQGLASVTVTDVNGCTDETSVNITQAESPTLRLETQSPTNCDGIDAIATVSVSGGTPDYAFDWSNGETGPTASRLPGGQNSVTVTDANGCTDVLTLNIITLSRPELILESQTVTDCDGLNGSATVSAENGSPGYTYAWSNGETGPTATQLPAGSNSVTVTDASRCTNTLTVIIEERLRPDLVIAAQGPTSCDGEDGRARVNATGGVPGYTYVWADGQTGASVDGLPPGPITVTVTDAVGCTDTVTVFIEGLSSPTLTLTSQAPTSCSAIDGSATVSASGGTPDYTFVWSNGETGPTASSLAQGSATVTVTDANGCTDEMTVTIEQTNSPTLSLENQTSTNCEGNNGSATVNANGGTPGYTFVWSNGENGPSASNLPGGQSTVTVTDANGCTDVLSVDIVTRSQPDLILESQTVTDCDGLNGSATVRAENGSPGYTYAWGNGETGPTATQLPGGSSTVTVTDASGCANTLTVIIEERLRPDLVIAAQGPTSCDGEDGRARVNATGGVPGYTYAWADGQTGASVDGLPPGPITVTVTDAVGCTDTVTVFIEGLSSPTLTLTGQAPTSCSAINGTATVSASGGTPEYTFVWSNGETGPTASSLAQGSATVTVTDANGCTDEMTVTIEQTNSPTLSLENQTSTNCEGNNGSATVSVNGGTPGYTFVWSNGENGPSASNLPGGQNSVTVTDANGCTDVLSVDIVTRSQPDLILESQTVTDCDGLNGSATVRAENGSPGYTYAWSNGETGPAATQLPGGSNSVTVTDASGCTNTLTVIIEERLRPDLVIAAQGPTSCDGEDGRARVNATGGVPGYTYVWADGQTGASVDGLPPGPITVTVTDAVGCTDTVTVFIEGLSSPTLTLTGQTTTSCTNNDGTATVGVSGGAPDYTFAWSNGETGPTASSLPQGIATVTVTDLNGCTDAISVTIEAEEAPELTVSSFTNARCGEPTGQITIAVMGGTPQFTYIWSHDTELNAPEAVDLAAGEYTVTVRDTNGCSSVITQTITDGSPPEINLLSLTEVACSNVPGQASFQLNQVSEGSIITVDDPNAQVIRDPIMGTSQTVNVINLSEGTFNLSVTNENGCVQLFPFAVTAIPAFRLEEASVSNVSCQGESDGSITVSVFSPPGAETSFTFQWDNGADNQTSSTAINLSSGTYGVTVTSALGCTAELQVSVSEPEEPLGVSATSTGSSCAASADGSVSLSASGGTPPYRYTWDGLPTETEATASSLAPGVYSFTVTDANNCSLSGEATIEDLLGVPEIILVEQTPETCAGDADASLTVSVSGDPTGITYAWSNGADTPVLTGLAGDETYELTVTSPSGCNATTSFTTTGGTVFVGPDLARDTSVCAGNFYVVDLSDYASSSIAGPNGFSSTDEVSVLDAPGQYVVNVTNEQGCSSTDTTNLSVTAEAFTARMVVASDAVISEPLVILEASFPAPTTVDWLISPAGATLSRQVNNLYYFDFSQPGVYDISLIAGSGGCEDIVTKRVTMHADSTTIPGLVLGSREILDLVLSPSPNDGNFSVTAELNGPQPFTLSLFRSNGERIASRRSDGLASIQENFALDLEAGTYYLQAQAGNDRRVLAVVVF